MIGMLSFNLKIGLLIKLHAIVCGNLMLLASHPCKRLRTHSVSVLHYLFSRFIFWFYLEKLESYTVKSIS